MNCMPTAHKVVSIVTDRELHTRLRTAAHRAGKSVSAFVRELVEERVRPRRARSGNARNVLLKLCGIAHGELAGLDVDRELYDR